MVAALYRFVIGCILLASVIWAVAVLYFEIAQIPHRNATVQLKHRTEPVTISKLHEAIEDYEFLTSLSHCYDDMSHTLSRLYLLASEYYLSQGSIAESNDLLQKAETAMRNQISCQPLNGKFWLDYMMVVIEREGVSPRALDAFKQSRAVTPSEVWLTQKRLEVALALLPMMDKEAIIMAQQDVLALRRSWGGRQLKFTQKNGLKSLEELDEILNAALAEKS